MPGSSELPCARQQYKLLYAMISYSVPTARERRQVRVLTVVYSAINAQIFQPLSRKKGENDADVDAAAGTSCCI